MAQGRYHPIKKAQLRGGVDADGNLVGLEIRFDSYHSMRIAQMPKVESIIMPSGGFWGGVGEPPVCVAPPAVLNAYFAATGRRIRSFPLRKHGIGLVESDARSCAKNSRLAGEL